MIVSRTTKLAVWAVVDLRRRALLAGWVIGAVTWGLSRVNGDATHVLPIALVFLLSASASLVLHALHLRAPACGRTVGSDVRRCVVWLGAGIIASMQTLTLLIG